MISFLFLVFSRHPWEISAKVCPQSYISQAPLPSWTHFWGSCPVAQTRRGGGIAHLGHVISMSKVYCEFDLYISVLSPSCFPFRLSLFRHREKNYFINTEKYNLTSSSTFSPQPLFIFHPFLLSFQGFLLMGVHPPRPSECSIVLIVSIPGDVTVMM